VAEADCCLECGGPHADAPCVVACPAAIDVPSFIGQIAARDHDAAARTIFAENLLGGTCGRVCPVEVLCEGACVLHAEGRDPIAIGSLQRFACDQALAGKQPVRESRAARRGRVAVIGAGPAGLACAGELAARGYEVAVHDEREEVGGLVRHAIAPFRQQCDPLPDEARVIAELGADIRLGSPIDSPERLAEVTDDADAVFLGVGMGKDLQVDIPGDDLPGVWDSLPFIEALKSGSPPAVGDHTIVVGGGNTAMDVAREALRLGAAEVTVLYRRTQREMPAYHHEFVEARDEGIRFSWLTNPTRFLGHNRLEAVECTYMRLAASDRSGRPRPEPVHGTEFTIAADTAVKALGQRPRAEFLAWIEGLELEHGRLNVDRLTGRTTNPKYYAGGDATSGGATVVEAVRDGKIAARSIDEAHGGGR
jgi:dihydropyrimidine dehydrogenase (NAD+) subunit PreT